MSYKVIICDDENIIRQGVKKIIQTSFDDVEIVAECTNGQEGYKQIVLNMPDLVITDIRMPNISGLEMIKMCEKLEKRPKFILISAYSEFEYARAAIKQGVSEYILKPIQRFELQQAVVKILGVAVKQMEDKKKQDNLPDSGIIGRAREYLEYNFYKNISLEEVSQQVGVNPNYLSSLFKKQLGMKYIDYLTKLRMEKARNLLINTDLKISDIAEMVGYMGAKHFARLYKEYFGNTPSGEREK